MQEFIVRYFPEILLKSRSVRQYCTKRLIWNIERLLKAIHPSCHVERRWAEARVTCPKEVVAQVKEILAHTPGIDKSMSIVRSPWETLEDIAEKAVELYGGMIQGKTLAVRVKRPKKKTGFTSQQAEREIGGRLMSLGLAKKVDLTHPEIKIEIVVEEQEALFFHERIPGLGGFPLGTQGRCLSMISGGYDSSVASFKSIRRGMVTHFLFFNLGGIAHERAVKQHAYYLWKRFGASHSVKFVSVPFEEVVAEILDKVDDGYMGVFIKRAFLKAATPIAARLNCPAIVTGEAIAQVSSQTLANLQIIDTATDRLVVRPLIVADKQETIRECGRIGTRAFADRMPEYCAVISSRPTIAANAEKMAKEEEKFPWEVLERAVEQAVYLPIESIAEEAHEVEEVPVFDELDPETDIIIDIRSEEFRQKRPLNTGSVPVIEMKLTEVQSRFPALPPLPDKRYALVCLRGITSREKAATLREAGFSNVGVYLLDSK